MLYVTVNRVLLQDSREPQGPGNVTQTQIPCREPLRGHCCMLHYGMKLWRWSQNCSRDPKNVEHGISSKERCGHWIALANERTLWAADNRTGGVRMLDLLADGWCWESQMLDSELYSLVSALLSNVALVLSFFAVFPWFLFGIRLLCAILFWEYIIFLQIYFFLFWVWMLCLHTSLCTACMQCPWRPEYSIGYGQLLVLRVLANRTNSVVSLQKGR